ncbi:CRISPR-associated ring nuclease Crn3/Csx3 [Nodosilinea nodulosa]|uniref:CRISPR-associated ring nuclease Crn3/Csx3 n=1 Tax=Nodosilinea nodulosa TaxID=416001 RepID=UPI00031E3A1B|nr:CRISPR-associated ring nuclease Crn3/Csx3 [Nodosilinea nodulosa]
MTAIQLTRQGQTTAAGLPYQHVHIHIATADGLIEPADLKGLALPPGMVWSQGVVLEGKAPIWLYSYLVHECHAAVWVACFDPRLGDGTENSGGAVVVATHSRQVAVGQVLGVTIPAIESGATA